MGRPLDRFQRVCYIQGIQEIKCAIYFAPPPPREHPLVVVNHKTIAQRRIGTTNIQSYATLSFRSCTQRHIVYTSIRIALIERVTNDAASRFKG